MRRSLVSFLILVSLGAPAAQADFVVAGSPRPVPSSPNLPASATLGAQDRAAKNSSAVVASEADAEEPRFKVARGFGDQVPLSFAVRQIVPHAVRVIYGPGAAPDALVTWKGGEGWNRVLLRAVHPLGLRLVMSTMAVQIRK